MKKQFEILRDFYKKIAMIFANITFIESDFSILSWEKNIYRLCITDLSLKDIIHYK